MVHRQYTDPVLRRLVTDVDFYPPGWGDRAIADLRLLVQCARAATMRDDLKNMRLLHLEPCLDCDGDVVRAILGSGLEVLLTFNSVDDHDAVVFAFPTERTEPRDERQ